MLWYIGLVVVLVLALAATRLRRVIIFEYERGLRYKRGRFSALLEPGSYWTWSRATTITRVDIRPTYVAVPGQEIPTSDGVSLKISVSAKYRLADPVRALHSVVAYQTALYTHLQIALREIVSTSPVDAVLENRAEIGRRLQEACAPKVTEFGIELLEADMKDVMLPGELKKIFAQVVKARQEGLAALERARGETAALRNLVNAAGLLEQRPALLQLRLLQAVGQTPGNTVVLGMGGQLQAIPLRQPLPESGSPRPVEGEES